MVSTQKNQRNNKGKIIYALSIGTQLGFLIVLPLIGFSMLGLFLDKKLNTFPIFLILGIIVSIMVTFFEAYYLLLPFLEKKVRKK